MKKKAWWEEVVVGKCGVVVVVEWPPRVGIYKLLQLPIGQHQAGTDCSRKLTAEKTHRLDRMVDCSGCCPGHGAFLQTAAGWRSSGQLMGCIISNVNR